MRPLRRSFFARPATEVGPDLLGKLLVRTEDGAGPTGGTTSAVVLRARIVEVEAYMEGDPACHADRGKTARNAPLFGPAGHAYVYFTYGMHWCLNVTTGREGEGQGCLLRAARPLDGLELMRSRRSTKRSPRAGPLPDRELLRGPARLAQAFGLDGAWSGQDVCPGPRTGVPALHLADDGERVACAAGPRTGVAAAADLPWRYVVPGSPWASPYKRHPNAP